MKIRKLPQKKGQLKIQQMAFMLIAVTLFFVLVGMFFLTIQVSKIRKTAEVLEEKNALLLVTKLAKKYEDFWGVSNIQIRKIYPAGIKECNIGNYPNCDIIKIYDGEITEEYSNFVSLCRKESFEGSSYNKCELGRLMVSYG